MLSDDHCIKRNIGFPLVLLWFAFLLQTNANDFPFDIFDQFMNFTWNIVVRELASSNRTAAAPRQDIFLVSIYHGNMKRRRLSNIYDSRRM